MFKLVVLSAILAVAAARPSLIHEPIAYGAYGATPFLHSTPLLSKTITYASEPVFTGYHSSILKPNLGYGLATPLHTVSKTAILAPARTVVDVHPEVTVVDSPVLAKVGHVVDHVPTAVSHQSSTVVHSKAAVVTPVLAPAYTKTIIAPAPITNTYIAGPAYGYASHSLPLAYASPVHAW